MISTRDYTLRKCKKILLGVYHLLRRKKKKLLPAQESEIRQDLRALQENVLKKNVDGANFHAKKCLEYSNGILRKSAFEQLRDFILALVVALAVALLIRQVWFELYEIPTGSMRPTFKEKDRLIVSKSKFGINFPFTTKHFYFDPDLVKRSGIFIFSVENLDVHDPDTLYFWIFPGKKQYVKRMMACPGDTVYFYGGQMYGIDKEGNEITKELQPEMLKKIDHVPFIHFDGNVAISELFQSKMGKAYRMAIIYQMGEPVARLTAMGNQRVEGELLQTPQIHNRYAPMPTDYSQLWGMGNYGMTRIVKKEEVSDLAKKQDMELEPHDYYLEVKHSPSLKRLELARDFYGRIRPQFALSTSLIPLDEAHLKALFDNLYTGRFFVKNGYAMRYSPGKNRPYAGSHFLVRLEGVPDGTYELYHGQAYQIKFGGYAQKLGPDHPLTTFSPETVRDLYNFGIEFDKRLVFGPRMDTARFAYFNQGDLYLLGAPIFSKADHSLKAFVENEKKRVEDANAQHPYVGFLDEGPPLKEDGSLDVEKIKQYGLLMPDEHYLALGDNFAMSADSRDFGFVPQGNIRGAPSFIFWPPGPRLGPPLQPSHSWLSLPNVLVWSLAAICIVLWQIFHNRHHRLPLKDLE